MYFSLGAGPKIAQCFLDLGYQVTEELKGENPAEMYQKLIFIRRQPVDRCVLYVFRCAVYCVSN
ncbi:MAG: helix-hairpin-helix domain-containing protein, partial [Desulfotomaculum sp.]|nr:helix-hairpin-helix domain-containing protein [Desulfotomaculum sp.]